MPLQALLINIDPQSMFFFFISAKHYFSFKYKPSTTVYTVFYYVNTEKDIKYFSFNIYSKFKPIKCSY